MESYATLDYPSFKTAMHYMVSAVTVRTAVHLFQLSHSPHVQRGPKGMFRSEHPVQAVIYEEVEAINTDTDNSPMNGSQHSHTEWEYKLVSRYLRFWKPVRYEAEAEAEEDDSLLRRVDCILDALYEICLRTYLPLLKISSSPLAMAGTRPAVPSRGRAQSCPAWARGTPTPRCG